MHICSVHKLRFQWSMGPLLLGAAWPWALAVFSVVFILHIFVMNRRILENLSALPEHNSVTILVSGSASGLFDCYHSNSQ